MYILLASFPGHSHILYVAAGYAILEVAWEQTYVRIHPLSTYYFGVQAYTHLSIDIRFKMIIPVHTPKNLFFQAGLHCMYKQKPKVLSGYCSNNCKVYKLVEFHKHV